MKSDWNSKLRRVAQGYAFTLIELLVVIVIVAMVAGMLLPTLARAKQHGHMAKCLSNLHQIGIGVRLYLDDNRDTFPPAALSQIDANVAFTSARDVLYGNFPGGKESSPSDMGGPSPWRARHATNRFLNGYVATPKSWHCPADRGFFGSSGTCFDTYGTCYRFNWFLEDDYWNNGGAVDPVYNLGLKKEDWVPDPARFIVMHEYAAFPWNDNGEVWVTQWHAASHPGQMFRASTVRSDTDRLLAPVLFADGHSQVCDFTAQIKANPRRALEPGKDWMWYKPQ